MDNKNIHKTSIGGQAVIEGIMMRGPSDIAIAVRKSDGEIVIDKIFNKDTFYVRSYQLFTESNLTQKQFNSICLKPKLQLPKIKKCFLTMSETFSKRKYSNIFKTLRERKFKPTIIHLVQLTFNVTEHK